MIMISGFNQYYVFGTNQNSQYKVFQQVSLTKWREKVKEADERIHKVNRQTRWNGMK